MRPRYGVNNVEQLASNQLVTNGCSGRYQSDESTFIFRGFGSNFSFLFQFPIKIIQANRIAPDGTPQSAASHQGLFSLPMSHKKDARLMCSNVMIRIIGFNDKVSERR